MNFSGQPASHRVFVPDRRLDRCGKVIDALLVRICVLPDGGLRFSIWLPPEMRSPICHLGGAGLRPGSFLRTH